MVDTPEYRANVTTMSDTIQRTRRLGYDGAETPSWHPKLTPYRLIIITTTIAFGSAKSILSQRQSIETPITLEWFFGTVLSIMFFMVSSYDSRENIPRYLHWLFKPDCMDPVWGLLLAWFSIKRPKYTSKERATPESLHRDRPSITPYRILVCTTVASVGMSKAMLGYYGFSTDVTWIDWTLGVPLTLILYVLGLYEYNSSDVWHTFFASDQIQIFYSLSALTMVTLRLSACAAWVVFWSFYLKDVTYNPTWDMRSLRKRPAGFEPTTRTFFEDLSDLAFKLLIQEFIIAAIVGGLGACFATVRQVMVRSGMMQILRLVRRRMARVVVRVFSVSSNWASHGSDLSTRRPGQLISVPDYARTAFRIVCHLGIHVIGLVVVGTFTMLSAGFTVILHDNFRTSHTAAYDIVCLTTPYILPGFMGCAVCGTVIGLGRILYSMLFPFWRWFVASTPFDNLLMAPRI